MCVCALYNMKAQSRTQNKNGTPESQKKKIRYQKSKQKKNLHRKIPRRLCQKIIKFSLKYCLKIVGRRRKIHKFQKLVRKKTTIYCGFFLRQNFRRRIWRILGNFEKRFPARFCSAKFFARYLCMLFDGNTV